jgi:hypothetical protein
LNNDTTLSQCVQPILTATQPLETSSSSPSSSAITTALNSFCSSSPTCSNSVIGTLLGQFYKACQSELTTSKVPSVGLLYDSLYIVGPFNSAICQKDSSGNYCVANDSSNTTKRASLDRRDGSQEVFAPDAGLFVQKNVALLGLSPDLSASQLCVSCTRQVMNDYTTQLSTVPYGPGINNSVLFPGQPALYKAINEKCGSSFLGGAVQAAGGLATGAAPRSADSGFAVVGSAIAAVAAGVVALL